MKAALASLPEDKLQKITLSLAQYEKAKKDENEIEWHGEMYDVAKVKFVASHVIVFALHDEAETNLIAFFEKVVHMTSQDNQAPPSALLQYLALVFTLPATLPTQDLIPSFAQQLFVHYHCHFLPVDIEILSPPPRA
jgi:hypothetical protein